MRCAHSPQEAGSILFCFDQENQRSKRRFPRVRGRFVNRPYGRVRMSARIPRSADHWSAKNGTNRQREGSPSIARPYSTGRAWARVGRDAAIATRITHTGDNGGRPRPLRARDGASARDGGPGHGLGVGPYRSGRSVGADRGRGSRAEIVARFSRVAMPLPYGGTGRRRAMLGVTGARRALSRVCGRPKVAPTARTRRRRGMAKPFFQSSPKGIP